MWSSDHLEGCLPSLPRVGSFEIVRENRKFAKMRHLGETEAPPQARGWTQRREMGAEVAQGSPAGAGMDP